MNTMNGPVVGCEIELRNGRLCGILPIGRCATCERAFCRTHQARTWYSYGYGVPYVDMCVPCFAKSPAEVARVEAEKRSQENGEARIYLEKGKARDALLTARVPPVSLYEFRKQWKSKGFFEQRHEWASVGRRAKVGRGWLLGEFWWKYNRPRWGGEAEYVLENSLTVLLDIAWQDLSVPELCYSKGFARVEPCSGGYELLTLRRRNDNFEDNNWLEAAQAVKRLIGESS